jgi:hypothetical protein
MKVGKCVGSQRPEADIRDLGRVVADGGCSSGVRRTPSSSLAYKSGNLPRAIEEMQLAIALRSEDPRLKERLAEFWQQQARAEEQARSALAERIAREEQAREIARQDALLDAKYSTPIDVPVLSPSGNLSRFADAALRGEPITDGSSPGDGGAVRRALSVAKDLAIAFGRGVGIAASPNREFIEQAAEPVQSGFSFSEFYQRRVLGLASRAMAAVGAVPTYLATGRPDGGAAADDALRATDQWAEATRSEAGQGVVKQAASDAGKGSYDGLFRPTVDR